MAEYIPRSLTSPWGWLAFLLLLAAAYFEAIWTKPARQGDFQIMRVTWTARIILSVGALLFSSITVWLLTAEGHVDGIAYFASIFTSVTLIFITVGLWRYRVRFNSEIVETRGFLGLGQRRAVGWSEVTRIRVGIERIILITPTRRVAFETAVRGWKEFLRFARDNFASIPIQGDY